MESASHERAVSIDSWRHFVPSRLERDEPFGDDSFETRPSTRVTFREPELPKDRSSSRLSFLRPATPFFGRASTSSSKRPGTVLGTVGEEKKKRTKRAGLWNLLHRKRERSPEQESIPAEPVRLNFLFVGAQSSGQTSLLFRSRYGYFPDARAIARTCYEDTSGAADLNNVWRLSYMAWDAVFLCFDVTNKVSMYTILSWAFVPLVYLVGMKKDLRAADFMEEQQQQLEEEEGRLGRPRTTASLAAYPTCSVGPSEAAWQAKRIGAHRYLECSALTGEGTSAVIDDVGREATRRAVERERETAVAARELRPVKKRRI
ncbi:hypothetical protein ACO1O0_006642 [Amphichorda felina]